MKNEIRFSYNWNNKLDCHSFTTLRLSDKYKIGDVYNILLRGKIGHYENKGKAKIIDNKSFLLNDINEFIARLDTGYSAEKCKQILTAMYKNKNVDWSKQKINFILFSYEDQ